MSKDNICFIHTSDWQLGMTRAFLSEEAGARFSQDRIDAIRTLGQLAAEHSADFIVVAGDVFESNQLSRQTVRRSLDALGQIAVPVYLLPGNHDPLDGSSIFLSAEFKSAAPHIHVIVDDQPLSVANLAGVEIIGAPWLTKHPSNDLCADVISKLEPTQTTRIIVAHGQTDSLSPDKTRPELINLANVEQAVVDNKLHYLALGDRHSVTDVGDSGRIWYSGAPVATDFDEVQPNQALLVTLDQNRQCEVTPLKVGDWQFIAQHQHVNSSQDVEVFGQWLHKIPAKQRTAIKVSFEGSVDLSTAALLDQVMEDARELFASLKLRQRLTDLHITPSTLDENSISLSGYAKATWQELMQSAQSGDENCARCHAFAVSLT